MANRTRSWTDRQLTKAVKENDTYASVLRALNLSVGGYNSKYIKKHIKRLGLSTEHFTGRRCSKNTSPTSFSSSVTRRQLIDGTAGYKVSTSLKKRLLKEGLLDEECAMCGIGPSWNNKPLTLQLDHINGDSSDNKLSNLRILCPNCHTQTSTYCGKNTKGKYLERICKYTDCSTKVPIHRAYCDDHAGYPTERHAQ